MAKNKLPQYPNLAKLPAIKIAKVDCCPVCETGREEMSEGSFSGHVDECLAMNGNCGEGLDWDSLALSVVAGILGLEEAKAHQISRAKAAYDKACDDYFAAN